ncbi:Cut8 six-helix bundle-domain-containing protein [Lipomyces oligophaga]|uniref:Cut8 six-helix bundle-domain-containing protein n=1 Tax=Lipomyces oligophaga TaxID=45792 RepID=UPI0034CDEB4C
MSAVLPFSSPHVGFPLFGQPKESPPSSPSASAAGPSAPATGQTSLQSPLSPLPRSSGFKRKISHDDDSDDEMVSSPESYSAYDFPDLATAVASSSRVPHLHHNQVHTSQHPHSSSSNHQHRHPNSHYQLHHGHAKRARTGIISKPLPLNRRLEILDPRELRSLIHTLVTKHSYLADEVSSLAPIPTLSTSLDYLNRSFNRITDSFPYKCDPLGDYAFMRVRPHVSEFLSAVSDYTQNFLPPREQQIATSLQFLDGVTNLVARLPEWTSPANNSFKHIALDELSRAWTLVIQEALKRANGIYLEYGGWREKIAKHNVHADNRLLAAVQALESGLGFR